MDSQECRGSDSMNVFLDSSQAVYANFGYQIIGDSLILSDSSLNATSYYWDFGDSSADSTSSPTHIYTGSGYYFVLLDVSNECYSDSSGQWIGVIMTNIEEKENKNIDIYPNPVSQQVFIHLRNHSHYLIVLKIYNTFGQLVHKQQWSENKTEKRKKIDLSHFAKGQYYFEFSGKTFKESTKVIID